MLWILFYHQSVSVCLVGVPRITIRNTSTMCSETLQRMTMRSKSTSCKFWLCIDHKGQEMEWISLLSIHRKSPICFRLAYLHLTLAQSKRSRSIVNRLWTILKLNYYAFNVCQRLRCPLLVIHTCHIYIHLHYTTFNLSSTSRQITNGIIHTK